MNRWRGVIEEYRKFLPVTERTPVVTLGEGNTPLIRATRLAKQIAPGIELYLKFEGMNPTGSFKDRGMTMAISKAVESGAKAVICASTGNTSASAAAYGARAGLAVYVLIPAGKIAMGKLSQAMMHQATVIQIEGNFDQALTIVKGLVGDPATSSWSTRSILIGSRGRKPPRWRCAISSAMPRLFMRCRSGMPATLPPIGRGTRNTVRPINPRELPRMVGFQAAGAAPIVLGRIVENPQTVATAIRIGNPASWEAALNAVKESAGAIDSVTDEEILQAYTTVAATEGVFCEPASAASVAGVMKLSQQGKLREGETVVCTLTGHGLKDADTAISVSVQPKTVRATREDVARLLRV